MTDFGLLGIGAKLGLPIARKTLEWAFQRDITSRAIDLALEGLDTQIEGLADHLERYRDSDDYSFRLSQFQAGSKPEVDDQAVAAFLEATDFHHGENTETVAAEILEVFFACLARAHYADKEGTHFLAVRNENLIESTGDHILSAVAEVHADIQEIMARRVATDDSDGSRVPAEAVLDARVDDARDLLNARRIEDAQRILDQVWPRLDEVSASPQLRFRVATNIGACALNRDDLKEARKWLLEASKHRPDSPKAPTNLALVDLIDGNYGGALSLAEQALAMDARNPDAMAVRIMALGKSGQEDALSSTLAENEWISSDGQCTHALGDLAYKDERFDEAERWLRHSLSLGEDAPETHELLADSLIGAVKQRAKTDPPFMAELAPEVRSQLEDAEAHLTIAIESFARREPKRPLHGALINRAATRAMLLNSQGAIDDTQRVLLDNPEPDVADAARTNAGRAYLLAGRPREAIGMFEAIASPDDRAEVTVALALMYFQIKEPRRALDILLPEWESAVGSERRLTIAELLVELFWDTGQADQVPPILAAISEQFGNDPRVVSIRAVHEERSGNPDGAIALLREGLSSASGGNRNYLALQLAPILGRTHSYSEAADQFRSIMGERPNGPLAQQLLQALFQAGRYREAWDLSEQIVKSGGATPPVMLTRAYLLGYTGDLAAAFDVYMELSRAEPSNVEHLVEAAQLAYRLGRRDEARAVLQSIRESDIWNDPDDLMRLAVLCLVLEIDGALRLAYRARRLAYDRPDIHGRYAMLVMHLEQEGRLPPPPEAVSVGSAVTLSRGDERRTFVILEDNDLSLARGEVAASEALAGKLLNLRVGDIVRLGGVSSPPFTVSSIQSCFIQAARETLTEAPIVFDEASPFQAIPSTPGEADDPLWRHLDGVRRHMVAVVRAYESSQLTLGAAARLGGRSVFRFWQDLVSDPSLSVRVADGDQRSRDQAIKDFTSASAVVLDGTAIFTIVRLGLEDRVRAAIPEILAHTATLDEITEDLATDHFGSGTLIAGENGRLISIPMDEGTREARRQVLQRARDFLLTACTLVPAVRVLDIGREKFDDLADSLSRGPISSALLAAERGALLWADDVALRHLARNDWEVRGAGTPHVLAALRERGDLADEDYFAAVRSLHVAGYVFVPVAWQDLLEAMKASQWHITTDVEATFASISGPNCSEASAIAVAAAFLRQLWLDSHFGPRRTMGVKLILGALVKGRSSDRVLELLRRAILVRFVLLPDHYRDEVLGEIAVWQRFRPTPLF